MKKIIFLLIFILLSVNSAFAVTDLGELDDICKVTYSHDLGISKNEKYLQIRYTENNDFAYLKTYNDGKQSLVINGVEGKKYKKIDGFYLAYGDSGLHYAYKAIKDGRWIIIKDGEKLLNNTNVMLLNFSEDGNSFSYVTEKNGKWYVVKDGKIISKGFDWIVYLVYSDKNNILYRGLNGNIEKDGYLESYVNNIKLKYFKGDDVFLRKNDIHLNPGYYKVTDGELNKFKNYTNSTGYTFGYTANSKYFYSDNKKRRTRFIDDGENSYLEENGYKIGIIKTGLVKLFDYLPDNKNITFTLSNIFHGDEPIEYFYINDKKVKLDYVYNVKFIGYNKIQILARNDYKDNIIKIGCDYSKFNYMNSMYIEDYKELDRILLVINNRVNILSKGNVNNKKEILSKILEILEKYRNDKKYSYLYQKIELDLLKVKN